MIKKTVALIQFDAVPEEKASNLRHMERLSKAARADGAQWIMFHEATLTDYTPKLSQLSEPVPTGSATRHMAEVAVELGCVISYGLSECDDGRYFITQVFVGPQGYIYHYRKTWLCRKENDEGYRNEWERYDPGTGPELFDLDGVEATCFICSDSAAPRCIQRAATLKPQVVLHPNNVRFGVKPTARASVASQIGAPVLVTNRVGLSWTHESPGGCAVISATGDILAHANVEGREEILIHQLEIPDRI